jgi:hypothetical protein
VGSKGIGSIWSSGPPARSLYRSTLGHLNRLYSVDDDEHGDDGCDEHGDDDYPCGDHDGAELDNYRLVAASEEDSYSRSPSWSERVRYTICERSTGASAPHRTAPHRKKHRCPTGE